MDAALQHKTALVTGASRRLGLAVARALVGRGFAVAIHASERSRAEAEAACAELLERSGVCLTPGSGFGAGGEGWARLALVHPSAELVAGARRMGSWLKQL